MLRVRSTGQAGFRIAALDLGTNSFHLLIADVHPDGSFYNLIHEDDILEMVPKLLDAAAVPATIVNWAGGQTVSVAEWCTELAEITGLEAKFVEDPHALASVAVDTTRMRELIGATSVDWRDGLRRLVAARHPELLGSR